MILNILFIYETFDALIPNRLAQITSEDRRALLAERKYFIAALLYNNEDIVSNWGFQMLHLTAQLGIDSIYVSIVENGDSTDRTAMELNRLESDLQSLKIPNTIITNKVIQRGNMD